VPLGTSGSWTSESARRVRSLSSACRVRSAAPATHRARASSSTRVATSPALAPCRVTRQLTLILGGVLDHFVVQSRARHSEQFGRATPVTIRLPKGSLDRCTFQYLQVARETNDVCAPRVLSHLRSDFLESLDQVGDLAEYFVQAFKAQCEARDETRRRESGSRGGRSACHNAIYAYAGSQHQGERAGEARSARFATSVASDPIHHSRLGRSRSAPTPNERDRCMATRREPVGDGRLAGVKAT
jgi:hypothetical protein